MPVELVALDFAFMGASMGSVVGEKIARAADRSAKRHAPLITVSASGGARMQEGIFALMQMAKTVTALGNVGAARTPHISILVFGGVASFLLVAIQLGDTMRAEDCLIVCVQ